MKLRLIAFAIVLSSAVAFGQNVTFQASADTAKPVPATKWWIRALGFTFPDGSKQTSAGIGKADSSTMPGYVTREAWRLDSVYARAIFAKDTTYKAAQLLKRVLYSDSGSVYASYPQFRDTLANVVKLRDSTVYATWPRLRDSLAAAYARNVRSVDSGSVYTSYPQFRDTTVAARSRYVWKADSGVNYMSWPQGRDSLASARARYVWNADSGVSYASYPQFRDTVASARTRYVWKADSGLAYASYPSFRDSLARVIKQRDSTVYATWPRLRDSSAAIRGTMSSLKPATAVYSDSTAKADWSKLGNVPFKIRGTSADSLFLKSDYPRASISVSIDSSAINTTDTVIVALPDYAIVLDSVGVYMQAGAAKDVDIKFLYSTNSQTGYTAIITSAWTVTSVTTKSWQPTLNNATLPANGVLAILFSETTAKPKQLAVHFLGKRQANGVNY